MDIRDACRPAHGPHLPGTQNHGFGVTPLDPARWCAPEGGAIQPTPAKGQFVPIAVGSLNGDMVVSAAFGSYVDPAYQRQWAVENIASIRNHRLDKEYRVRSQEMLLQRNQFRSPMAPPNDSLMFSCVRTDEELQNIADNGYVVRSTSSNYLGDGMKGVTLSCHADIHLKVAQLVVTHTCWMIISKVVLGNRRMVTEVREGAVDVTPDYDSHLFAVGPNISQTLSEQAIRNQAFFFEFDSAGNTYARPRQILPFHAIKFRNVDSFSLRLTAGDSLRVPLPLAVVQPTQATQQNRETSDAIQSTTTPSSQPNLPSAAQGGLSTTRLPLEYAVLDNQIQIRANETQQNSVSVMLGIQSLLNHMTVESGLGNEPIQTSVLSGIQNQLNSLAVQSGLDNQQNYLALLSGLQSQLTYLFIQSGLQSQNVRPESAPQSQVSGKEPTDASGSHTGHVDQCTPSPQSGDVNHDPAGLTVRPCDNLSMFELPCSGFPPQADPSHDRLIATQFEEISSYLKFGMRLSIVAPPGATDCEPVESGADCFQPIVIKPESAPSFLRAPPEYEQQYSASVCTQEVIPTNAPGFLLAPPAFAQDPCIGTQNPLLLNLIRSGKDASRVPELHHPTEHPSALFQLLRGDMSVDHGTTGTFAEVHGTTGTFAEDHGTTGTFAEYHGTTGTFAEARGTTGIVTKDSRTTGTFAEDHGTTGTFAEDPTAISSNLSDVILGTVSDVVPNGSTQPRVTKTFDEVLDGLLKDVAALSSACCDISSGMKRKSLPAPVEVAAEGDASNAGNDIEDQSQDVSRMYVHDDDSLELVIVQLVSDDDDSATDDDTDSATDSATEDDSPTAIDSATVVDSATAINSATDVDSTTVIDSATNDDPFECSFESYEDRVNWRRFLTDERFQPSVMLERLNIV